MGGVSQTTIRVGEPAGRRPETDDVTRRPRARSSRMLAGNPAPGFRTDRFIIKMLFVDEPRTWIVTTAIGDGHEYDIYNLKPRDLNSETVFVVRTTSDNVREQYRNTTV